MRITAAFNFHIRQYLQNAIATQYTCCRLCQSCGQVSFFTFLFMVTYENCTVSRRTLYSLCLVCVEVHVCKVEIVSHERTHLTKNWLLKFTSRTLNFTKNMLDSCFCFITSITIPCHRRSGYLSLQILQIVFMARLQCSIAFLHNCQMSPKWEVKVLNGCNLLVFMNVCLLFFYRLVVIFSHYPSNQRFLGSGSFKAVLIQKVLVSIL